MYTVAQKNSTGGQSSGNMIRKITVLLGDTTKSCHEHEFALSRKNVVYLTMSNHSNFFDRKYCANPLKYNPLVDVVQFVFLSINVMRFSLCRCMNNNIFLIHKHRKHTTVHDGTSSPQLHTIN